MEIDATATSISFLSSRGAVSVNDPCFDLVMESVEEVGVNENHHENNDGLVAAESVTQNDDDDDDDEMDSQNLHVCHGVVEVVNVIYHLNNVEVNHFRDELVVEVSVNQNHLYNDELVVVESASHLYNDDGLAAAENVNQNHPDNDEWEGNVGEDYYPQNDVEVNVSQNDGDNDELG
jgi:hypothetical protein